MRFYFVDYENVQANGLRGVRNIAHDDRIFLFYTENANKLDFALYEEFLPIHGQIEPFCVQPGQHSLDFQLSSFLGYQLAENPDAEMVIISKDNGFNSVVRFWTGKGRHVFRVPALSACPVYKAATASASPAEPQEEKKDNVNAAVTVESIPEPVPVEPENEAAEQSGCEAMIEAAAVTNTAPANTETEGTAKTEAVCAGETEKEEEKALDAAAAERELTPADVEVHTEKAASKRPNRRRKSAASKSKQAESAEQPHAAVPDDTEPIAETKAQRETEQEKTVTDNNTVKAELMGKLTELSEGEAENIANLIGRYKTRQGLNNALQKDFGSDRTGTILKAIRPYIRDKK